MSDIGFNIETDEQFQELAERAYDEGEVFETPDGTYIKWAPGDGVELWLQVDHEGAVAVNPHFSGTGLARVALNKKILRTEGNLLDCAFHAWANPHGAASESGDCPFVFDVPDYQLNAIELPAFVTIQLAAFAHELESFDNDEAYYQSQPSEFQFASESFIPSGLFLPGGEKIEPPLAEAVFTGHILETSLVTNVVTGAEFCWARTRTIVGEIDVVADPVLLNGPMIEGGVLTGSFWLSGRLVS